MGVAQTTQATDVTGPDTTDGPSASAPTSDYERGEQIGYEKARSARRTVAEEGLTTATRAALQGMIKGIGGAIIAAFMVIVVLSQDYALDIISSGSGPFANLTSDFVTYGTAALGLVGVGLIVGAAAFAMDMFGGGGMGR